MRTTRLFLGAATLLALLQLSCATSGFTPGPPTMPVARLGLDPEYRIFYDTLIDYGDWILIEPYGYVFRPRVAYESWSPYGDGFWVPTDLYGWVWISREPFGWATYHYGRWFADPYQGWVWMPGNNWGPGWVTWTASSGFVGWAPLPPSGYDINAIPSGAYRFVQTADLGDTDLASRELSTERANTELSMARPIDNIESVDGVRINRGPSFDMVERAKGPIQKVEIENLAPGRPGEFTTKPVAGDLDPVDATRRAAAKVTREARELSKKSAATPLKLPVLKIEPKKLVKKSDTDTTKPAKRDSTR